MTRSGTVRIYDISQTLREGIAVWPGDRKFRSRWSMQIRLGQSCNVSEITLSTHTGTHLDAPRHFDDSGLDIADIPLEHCIGPARVVSVSGESIGCEYLARRDWFGVERVLLKTRSSDTPESRFDRHFVFLSDSGAEFLGRLGLRLVGTDAPSIDPYVSKNLSAHKILLRHEVAILEGLRLAHVPDGDYELICLPLKLAGLDGSPVRAVLRR